MLRKYVQKYCLLLMLLCSSLHAIEKKDLVSLQHSLYQKMFSKKLKGSQWLGIVGFSGITCYILYRLLPKLFIKSSSESYNAAVLSMTPKDLIVLELLISCAARDLDKIHNGEHRIFEVVKVKLDEMSPYYAAEAEYMRYEFLQTAALCLQDESIKPRLTAWFLQWKHAVEEACNRARAFFMQKNSMASEG